MKRWISLLLICCFLMPMMISCKDRSNGKERTIDSEFSIVFDEENKYAESGALLLQSAIKNATGQNLKTIRASIFDAEAAGGKAIFVGDTGHTDELSELEEGEVSVLLRKEGMVIRAGNPYSLYLLVMQIAEHWGTADYGLQNGALTINGDICEKLSQLDLKTDRVITVMTQNIRYADDGAGNDIDDRKVRFKQLMEDYSPDLLGTQEVTAKWKGIFEEYFSEAYGIVGEKGSETSWNLILYKKERFDLVETGTFWLTDTPDVPSALPESLVRFLTWAILKDKVTGQEILFCNTHLQHKEIESIRVAQAGYVMNFINQYKDRYPVYLTGDFNTTNNTKSYGVITASLADAHKQSPIDDSDVKGTCHNYTTKENIREIDYCFYDADDAKTVYYRILSDDYDGFVSDHYGVVAKFMPR